MSHFVSSYILQPIGYFDEEDDDDEVEKEEDTEMQEDIKLRMEKLLTQDKPKMPEATTFNTSSIPENDECDAGPRNFEVLAEKPESMGIAPKREQGTPVVGGSPKTGYWQLKVGSVSASSTAKNEAVEEGVPQRRIQYAKLEMLQIGYVMLKTAYHEAKAFKEQLKAEVSAKCGNFFPGEN